MTSAIIDASTSGHVGRLKLACVILYWKLLSGMRRGSLIKPHSQADLFVGATFVPDFAHSRQGDGGGALVIQPCNERTGVAPQVNRPAFCHEYQRSRQRRDACARGRPPVWGLAWKFLHASCVASSRVPGMTKEMRRLRRRPLDGFEKGQN